MVASCSPLREVTCGVDIVFCIDVYQQFEGFRGVIVSLGCHLDFSHVGLLDLCQNQFLGTKSSSLSVVHDQ